MRGDGILSEATLTFISYSKKNADVGVSGPHLAIHESKIHPASGGLSNLNAWAHLLECVSNLHLIFF